MKKLFKNILFDTLLFGIFIILIVLINYNLGLMFRLWVYYVIAVILVIGFIAGIIQAIVKAKSKLSKTLISIPLVLITVLIVLGWPLIFFVLAFSYKPEHVIEKDGKKYVAYVNSFLNVDVYYFDYKNFFLMGNKIKIKEYYGKGGYDPFDKEHSGKEALYYEYYNNDGKIIDTNRDGYIKVNNGESTYYEIKAKTSSNTTNEQENDNKNNENNIYWIDENIAYKVISEEAAMGYELVEIYRTDNSGNTWHLQSSITLHYNSKFIFINDNLSFVYDPGRAGVETEYGSLKSSTDSANTYTDCIIEHPKSISEINLIIDGLPIYENNQLKLKIYTINYKKDPIKTYYEYISEDGVNWYYDK